MINILLWQPALPVSLFWFALFFPFLVVLYRMKLKDIQQKLFSFLRSLLSWIKKKKKAKAVFGCITVFNFVFSNKREVIRVH